jgi:poly(A) polymerase
LNLESCHIESIMIAIPDVPADARHAFATEVVARLRRAGFQSLWAGGCVRDLLLGLTPADYDVATDATPEQVMGLFRRTVPVGVSFGVVRVLGPRGAGEVEVATFRSDGAYVDGRRPESVRFGSPEEDASRRDFTINGMFLDPLSGEVLDYVGGRADLERRVLRAIGDPAARFEEDKLRLLRAARFAARFGLAIDRATREALVAMAGQVRVVAVERIAQELRRMLVHPTRAKAMDLAFDTGLVAAILPPLVPMKGLFQGKPVQPEGDLWDHTLLVLENLPPEPSFPLAFAALLHDVGKPATKGLQDGRVTFYNHEVVGRRIAEDLCRALKLSNEERERVAWLVEFHQYLGAPRQLRESKFKRMLAMPGIEELLALHRADALATTGDASNVDYCERYLRERPEGEINPPALLTGHDLLRHGLRPGPLFKQILDRVREAQLERRVGSKKEALELVDRLVAEQPGDGEAPDTPV